MNRRIVYTAQIPLSTDFLQSQKDALQAIGQLAQDVLTSSGSPALLVGLACTSTNPASMTVDLGPGSVYQRGAMDGTAFGSLLADATSVMQQGFSTTSRNLGGFVAPTTQGQTIDYLVQAQFQQVDARPLVLPYYNSANPQVPLVGPGGNGASQSTDRTGILAVQVVAGAAAATGTQNTPPVTSGWLAAYIVSVSYGQTSIGAPNIKVHPLAPFLASLTSQHHLGLPGTAPQIDLSTEVRGKLPGSAIATDDNGIATGVNAEKLDGYGASDLLYNGSYGQPLASGGGLTRSADGSLQADWDDGTRQSAKIPRGNHSHANDATGGLSGAPFAKLGTASGATSANSTVVHANSADSATTASSAGTATSAGSATYAQALKQSGQGILGIVQSGGHVYLWANTDSSQSSGNAGTVRVSNADYADSSGSTGTADALANQMDGAGGIGLTETKFKASGYYYSNLNFVAVNVPSGRSYVGAIAYQESYDGDPGDTGHRPGISFGGNKVTTDSNGNIGGRVVYFWGE